MGILLLTQKITADPNHALHMHINQVRKFHISLHPFLGELQ